MSAIYGNVVGSSTTLGKSVVIKDDSGTEFVGVVVDQETVLTATPNDIRKGKIAATEDGIIEGEKEIPAYHTTQGARAISVGSEFIITSLKDLNKYDYTKLQAIICDFNTSLSDSVSTNKVCIDDNVYDVQSTERLSVVTKNDNDKIIEFGIINETSKPQILRFFTYKEIE